MSDPNLTDFYRRVRRLEKARSRGYGFEAAGTLGRSYYSQPLRRRVGIFKPLIILAFGFFGLKSALYYSVGGEVYQTRADHLAQGESLERVGAWIMQADPVTQELARRIGQGVAWVKRSA